MPRRKDTLYVGTNRHVAAIEARTGEEIWRTKLGAMGGSIVSIVIKGNFLYVGAGGYVYCLARRDGTIVWENGLPRMGYHPVNLVMEGATNTSADVMASAVTQRRTQQSAAGAGATS